jgi:hypothetical protein
VTVTDSHGDTVTDSDGFAGMLLESIVYDGAGTGNQVTDTIDLPAGTTTGTDSNTKIPSVMANYAVDETFTTLAGGGTRESTESYTYNSYGQVATDSKVPDTSNPAEDTCTTYTYAVNTSTGLVDLPATKQVVDLPCGTTPTQASQLVSYTANTYDNGASSPTAGNLTKVQQATSATVEDVFGDYIWQYTYGSTDSYTYDEYGRPLTATDADNRTTSTAYTPATGAEPTSVQVTDPAGLVTTTTYDPARDVPLTVTDPAEGVTAKVYDALGRVTSSWTPGNPASGPAVDTYTYTTSNTAPSVVTEQTEQPGGGYLTSETLFDSMAVLRLVSFRGFDLDAVKLPDEPSVRVIRNWTCVLDEALALVSGRSDETGRALRALIKNNQRGLAKSRYHPLGLFNRDDYVRLGGEELAVLAEAVFAQAEHVCQDPQTT